MKKYWIGIDIGGTKCAVNLAHVDCGIHIDDRIQFDTNTHLGKDFALDKIFDSIHLLLENHGLTSINIHAIGISCGGPLDSRRGVILCPPNLPGWENVPIVEMLWNLFGIKAYIQNDANACALVEWKLGAGRDTDSMVFLTMGTGLGAGIISHGKLIEGFSGMAGEVGHLRLREKGTNGFGKSGSFEGFASGGGITRRAIALTSQLVAQGNPPQWIKDGYKDNEINAKLLAEYAMNGDEDAKQLYAFAGKMLGRGIAILVDILNPRKIIIGSIFARCEALLRPAMQSELAKEALAESLRDLKIVPAHTGEALGDLASIMTALFALDVDPFDCNETNTQVHLHYSRLFERYPVLNGCKTQIMTAYKILLRCYNHGGKVLVVGNGGSCADGEHIVGELMKGFYLKRPLPEAKKEAVRLYTEDILPGASELFQQGLPAIALTAHTALGTAIQNDLDAAMTAAQQLMSIGEKGDVLIAISSSGNAKNIALAVQTAKAVGIESIGLSGESGGKLRALCECIITVPGTVTADIQELHLPVYHTLCAMLEAKYFSD